MSYFNGNLFYLCFNVFIVQLTLLFAIYSNYCSVDNVPNVSGPLELVHLLAFCFNLTL